MENKYGVKLDLNGYAPSIVQSDADVACALCVANGCADPLNRHEIFGGAYRAKSKALGLWVSLCHAQCHQLGRHAVHNDMEVNRALRQRGQRAAMQAYGWSTEDFIREFGKNYLEESRCLTEQF